MSDENPIKRLNDLLDIAEKHGEWLKEIDTRVGALETNCEHSFAKVEDHVKRFLEIVNTQSDSIDMLDRFLKDVNIHHSALISRNNDKLAVLEQKFKNENGFEIKLPLLVDKYHELEQKVDYAYRVSEGLDKFLACSRIKTLESVLTSYNQLIWDILWTFDPNSTENPSERIKELRERLNSLNEKLGGETVKEREWKEEQRILAEEDNKYLASETPPRTETYYGDADDERILPNEQSGEDDFYEDHWLVRCNVVGCEKMTNLHHHSEGYCLDHLLEIYYDERTKGKILLSRDDKDIQWLLEQTTHYVMEFWGLVDKEIGLVKLERIKKKLREGNNQRETVISRSKEDED